MQNVPGNPNLDLLESWVHISGVFMGSRDQSNEDRNPPRSRLKSINRENFKFEIAGRIFTLASIFVAASFFIVVPSLFFSMSDSQQQILNVSVVAITLFLTFLADSIQTTVYTKNTHDLISQSHDQILETIEGHSSITAFGSQTAFEQHLHSRISSAIEVKNTFVSFRTASGNPNAVDPSAIMSYKKFFEAPASGTTRTWIDIVSYNEVFGPRYEELNKVMRPEEHTRHVLRVIRHNIPILNFTIIYYDSFSQRSEVVFGWMHSDISTHHKLFRSTDPNIIEMFEMLFNLMSQYRIQPDFDIRYGDENFMRASNLTDRSGWWYCLGVVPQNSDHKGCKSPISESMFRISFMENGAEIEGQVRWMSDYGHQSKSVEHFSHRSEKVSFTEDKIFLEYRLQGSDRRGICVYNFKTRNGRGAVDGYLQDSNEKYRVQLYGIRLDLNGREPSWSEARDLAHGSFLGSLVDIPDVDYLGQDNQVGILPGLHSS